MEEPQQHSRNSKDGEDSGGDHSISSVRRRTGPRNRIRRPLFLRCLLIRNLPKGFVGWSDLTDNSTPIRVRRIVYCEESNGSIMVEIMSEAERNKILALDRQRKRRISQRIQQQALQEGTSEINANSNNSKSYAFEIKVTVERCASEKFVRTVLSGDSNNNTPRGNGRSDPTEPENSDAPPLSTGTFTDPTSPLAGPPPSPLPPSPLVRRCIVIRKCSNKDNIDEDLDIPKAPPYEINIGADDGSIRSADSLRQKQQRPPPPMEIRSGKLSELVVRGVTLQNKSKMMPAMVVELESEESVDRIMMAEEAKQRMENAEPTTLAIPVEIHAVKSERNARLCFRNTRINRKQNETKRYSGLRSGSQTESRVTMIDEMTNNTDIGYSLTIEEVAEENIDNIGYVQMSNVAVASNNNSKNPRNPLSSFPDQTESVPLDEPNYHQEWIDERKKTEILEGRVRELLAENERHKSAESAQFSLEAKKDIQDPAQKEQELQKHKELMTENDNLKARVAEMENLESKLKESSAQLEQVEAARNKLEDENSGLLRYVLELEGHRSGKAMADEERYKELEKKHSDLSTLYRFVQGQAEESAKDLRNAIEEKGAIRAELEGFKVAWRTRMETQRRLENSRNKDGGWVCIDCETVKFHAILEDCKNSDGNTELGEESAQSDYESESAPSSNGVLPGPDQTNGKAPEPLMT